MPLTTESALRKDITQPSGHAVMQHRHFAEIARIIREINMFDSERSFIAEHFADNLAKTNPRFDRKRFLTACR